MNRDRTINIIDALLISKFAAEIITIFSVQKAAIQWQKCLVGSFLDFVRDIQKTNDGEYIIAGETSFNEGDVLGFVGFWNL